MDPQNFIEIMTRAFQAVAETDEEAAEEPPPTYQPSVLDLTDEELIKLLDEGK